MKICIKCNIGKELVDFKKSGYKDHYKSTCKVCETEYNKKYYLENKDYFKEHNKKYGIENREALNKSALDNYYENKDYYSLKSKEYREENRDRLNQSKREWDKNRSIADKRKYRNEYQKIKFKNDPLYKMKANIRSYISSRMRKIGVAKQVKSSQIIGISFIELKIYLESKFESWMSWENYGLYNGESEYGWDIDHIIPLSTGSTEEDLIKLNHYTNLQPLCSNVNRNIKKDSTLIFR